MVKHLFSSSHVLSLLSQCASAVLGMTIFLLYAKWMSPNELGQIILFITSITIADMLRSGFIQAGFVKFFQGSDPRSKRKLLAASFALSFGCGIGLSILLLAIRGTHFFSGASAELYLVAWPLLSITSFPGQWYTWVAQAETHFDRILGYRLINSLCVLGGVIALHVLDLLNPLNVGYVFCAAATLASGFVFIKKWARIPRLRDLSADYVKKLVNFGRFSMTTLLGTSLLKSSDTYLIGLFLGVKAVAIYGVAQKIAEVLEIPLRAISASMYPLMARPASDGNTLRIGRIIERFSSGYLLALLIPGALLLAFAPAAVLVVGGPDYSDAIWVVRIFVIAAFFFPLDRMIGLALDGLNRPNINMYKVMLMLALNGVGDIIVLMWFPSLWAVSVVTVIVALGGMTFGLIALQPDTKMSFQRALTYIRWWTKPAYLRLHLEKSTLRN